MVLAQISHVSESAHSHKKKDSIGQKCPIVKRTPSSGCCNYDPSESTCSLSSFEIQFGICEEHKIDGYIVYMHLCIDLCSIIYFDLSDRMHLIV